MRLNLGMLAIEQSTEGCLRQPPTGIHIEKITDHLREAEIIADRSGELNSAQLSRSVGDKDRDNRQCRRHVCDKRSHMPEGIAGINGDLVAGTSQACLRHI